MLYLIISTAKGITIVVFSCKEVCNVRVKLRRKSLDFLAAVRVSKSESQDKNSECLGKWSANIVKVGMFKNDKVLSRRKRILTWEVEYSTSRGLKKYKFTDHVEEVLALAIHAFFWAWNRWRSL